MKAVFDYFLTQLNDNTSGLVYKGNYVFRYFQDTMKVYDNITNTLVNEEVEFSPVAILSKDPVTFVEKNNRVDWLVEFGFLVRIEGEEYDPTVDLDYNNIVSVLSAMQNQALTIESKRYSVKVDKEPKFLDYVPLGESDYAFLVVTMNITEVTQGYFGQDWTLTIAGKEIDFANVNITTTKRHETIDSKSDTTNDYHKSTGRSMVWEVTLNYDDETDLLDEVMGVSNIKGTYSLVMTFNNVTWTYAVTVESTPMTIVKGGVMQLTLRFIQATDSVVVT